MILNGYLPSPWSVSNYSEITMNDWFGNKISLPAVSSLSLVFSIANMIRAANVLGIYKTYGTSGEFKFYYILFCLSLGISYKMIYAMISASKMFLLGKIFDYLPFLITSTMFRIVMI